MTPIINFHSYAWLDFSEKNEALKTINLENTEQFSEYVFQYLAQLGVEMGVGGYLENRVIYRKRNHFVEEQEPRNIHLGIDIWAAAETPIFAPFDGIVHSFQNNDNFGDYGPTIILEHQHLPENLVKFDKLYTLYGHLTLDSIDGLFEGKKIKAGEQIAKIGNFPVNGDWPPHLHFQVMTDMLGKKGDFPGVCAESEKTKYQAICIDPNLILQLKP